MRPLFALVLISLLAAAPNPALALDDPDRLGDAVRPTFQEIVLRLDAREADYTGTTRVELRVERATDTFRFHAESLELTELVLTRDGEAIPVTHAAGDVAVITVTASRTLEPGDYVLDIAFADDFDTQAHSLYRLDVGGEGYSFTQMEADDAREAFPCWDEPAFKFPYRMTLIVPDEHLAIFNTPIESETSADGWRTVVFETTPPLPSYLLAIATGPLDTVEIPGLGVPGRVVTVKGQAHLAEEAVRMTPPLLHALEEYFDSPYPYKKLDLLAVPEFWPGAMENPGAITFADRILLLDPATTSIAQQRRLAAVTAHELAHMWYGDVVTMTWWDDLWLNESFASWMGDKITDRVYPQFNMRVTELGGISRALQVDAQVATRAIRQPVAAADNLMQAADVLAYSKGQGVLGMVEQWIGPEAFRKGVLAYIEENAWGNATGDDLWNALGEASGEDVSACLTSFLDQGGFPLVSATVVDGGVELGQRRFLHHGVEAPEKQLWRVPITFKYKDDAGVHEQTVLLQTPSTVVSLETRGDIAWIHPNVEQRGFYRWNVSPAGLKSLAAESVALMSIRERVGFLGNLSALLDAGMIAGDDYLDVLGKFADDPEPEVVSALMGGLGKVEGAFVPEEAEHTFAFYVRRTLGPALARFGLEKQPDEPETVSLFRPRLIAWMADTGKHAETLAYAKGIAERYLKDPASVDPSLAGVCVQLMAMDGNRELFEDFRQRFETATAPADRSRFLSALGNFHDPELTEEALRYALDGPLRPNEIFNIPMGIGGQGEGAQLRLWEWMTANYDVIAKKLPPAYMVYMPYFAGGCDDGRVSAATSFFGDPDHSPPGTEKELAKVMEGIVNCMGLREREGAAVMDYLNRLAEAP